MNEIDLNAKNKYHKDYSNLLNIINDDKFDIHFLTNIKEAESFLTNNEVHIIICERDILVKDNPNFFKWVGDNKSLSHITKILISSDITSEDLIYSINDCMIFRYFIKPFTDNIIEHLYHGYKCNIINL